MKDAKSILEKCSAPVLVRFIKQHGFLFRMPENSIRADLLYIQWDIETSKALADMESINALKRNLPWGSDKWLRLEKMYQKACKRWDKANKLFDMSQALRTK